MADYPAWLEEHVTLEDGAGLFLRPIRRSDWRMLQRGFRRLTPEDRYFRFLGGFSELSDERAKRLAGVDYEHEIAILALAERGKQHRGVGIVRMVLLDPEQAEIALVILPGWKRRGLGRLLAERALAWARSRGIAHVQAVMLSDNRGMRSLALALGFEVAPMQEEPGMLRADLALN